MNNKRRAMLKKAKHYLDLAAHIIETTTEEEDDCLCNMPENLQSSERYERSERALENLGNATEYIENAAQCLEEAVM